MWWIALALASIGVGATVAAAPWGPLAAVGGAVILLHLAWTMFPGRRVPLHIAFAGVLGGFLAVLGALGWALDARARVILVALGFQLQLAAAAATREPLVDRFSSFLVAALGHATMLLGAALLWTGAGLDDVATVGCAGLAVVLLHAFWRQRARGGPGEEWELILVCGVMVVAAAPVLARFTPRPAILIGVALLASLLCVAVLARPPKRLEVLARRPRAVGRALAQGVALVVLVNVVLLAYSLVSHLAIRVVVGVLFFWLLLSVVFEYRSVLYARRHLVGAPSAPEAEVVPGEVTVVIVAASEADVLRGSLAVNLALDLPLEYVIVPAAGSSDETVEVAHAAARAHPGRVRVVLGTTGSKARDLNLVWPTVETPYLLVLDADETIDAASLRRLAHALREDHGVAVAQARKLDPDPERSTLSRFIACERRYSTWIDQSVQAEDGGAHFAGSAALIRWGALHDIDGWRDDTLTEDIDFTLRLAEGTSWRIAYVPSAIVREATPRSLRQLVRQRTRWARGWAQVTAQHLPRVWRARRHLGLMRTISYTWQLLASVSGPWMVLLPLLSLIRLLGLSDLLPLALALPLAMLIMPSRGIAYLFAAWHDPVLPVRRSPRAMGEVLLHAYLWLAVGWIIQLHAIYLQLADAPQEWSVTGKRAHRAGARAA